MLKQPFKKQLRRLAQPARFIWIVVQSNQKPVWQSSSQSNHLAQSTTATTPVTAQMEPSRMETNVSQRKHAVVSMMMNTLRLVLNYCLFIGWTKFWILSINLKRHDRGGLFPEIDYEFFHLLYIKFKIIFGIPLRYSYNSCILVHYHKE